MIKQCFIAPKGWLFTGADFSSLEDRIDALLTKDPNKVKVYTQGFDGHSLRAHGYFSESMPDIRKLPDDYKEKSYKVKVGNTFICFLASDIIEYENIKYTGKELYEKITN